MASRLMLATLTGLALSALAAPAAGADGLPVLGEDASRRGVISPDESVRYVTLGAKKETVVASVDADGGRVIRSLPLTGQYTIPVVAYDGTPGGLSADGETLVLIRPRQGFPRPRTPFAVIDTRRLRLRDAVTLPGDFSFDAISPDGSLIYLIEYLSRRDPTRYHVRAYDLQRQRLLPDLIVDPEEPGERMGGNPLARASSPDGRWAYTLYDGAAGHPFIHALDTVRGEAVCIDLHDVEQGRAYSADLLLSDDGSELTVATRHEPLALVDLGTFEVTDPPTEPPATPPATSDGDAPWTLIALAGLAAWCGAVAIVVARRRRRSEEAVETSEDTLFVPNYFPEPQERATEPEQTPSAT